MKTIARAGMLLSALMLPASLLLAQEVSSVIVIRNGPAAQPAEASADYSSYADPRRVIVLERRAPRVVVVESLRRKHGRKHWNRSEYRRVVVYYLGGRYYDRFFSQQRGLQGVVVYERNGHYYLDDDRIAAHQVRGYDTRRGPARYAERAD